MGLGERLGWVGRSRLGIGRYPVLPHLAAPKQPARLLPPDAVALKLKTICTSACLLQAEPASNGGAAEAASAEPAAAGPGTVLEDGSVVFKF